MALFGWETELTPGKQGGELLSCTICQRHVAIWNFADCSEEDGISTGSEEKNVFLEDIVDVWQNGTNIESTEQGDGMDIDEERQDDTEAMSDDSQREQNKENGGIDQRKQEHETISETAKSAEEESGAPDIGDSVSSPQEIVEESREKEQEPDGEGKYERDEASEQTQTATEDEEVKTEQKEEMGEREQDSESKEGQEEEDRGDLEENAQQNIADGKVSKHEQSEQIGEEVAEQGSDMHEGECSEAQGPETSEEHVSKEAERTNIGEPNETKTVSKEDLSESTTEPDTNTTRKRQRDEEPEQEEEIEVDNELEEKEKGQDGEEVSHKRAKVIELENKSLSNQNHTLVAKGDDNDMQEMPRLFAINVSKIGDVQNRRGKPTMNPLKEHRCLFSSYYFIFVSCLLKPCWQMVCLVCVVLQVVLSMDIFTKRQ